MAKRLSATERLRSNIKRTIRSLEKRGYDISKEIKEKISTGKFQTLKSFQKNRYKKLYREATAKQNGQAISGTRKRQLERQQSARKAKETVKRRKQQSSSSWEKERRRQDAIDRESAQQFQEGEIVYSNIIDMINQYPTKGAKHLSDMLSKEIAKYGKENVIMAMSQAPDTAISYARTIVFYEDSSEGIHTALQEFAGMITGSIPDADEAKEMGEVMDEL